MDDVRAVLLNQREQNVIFNILQPQATTQYSWRPFEWIETDIKSAFHEFEWDGKSATIEKWYRYL